MGISSEKERPPGEFKYRRVVTVMMSSEAQNPVMIAAVHSNVLSHSMHFIFDKPLIDFQKRERICTFSSYTSFTKHSPLAMHHEKITCLQHLLRCSRMIFSSLDLDRSEPNTTLNMYTFETTISRQCLRLRRSLRISVSKSESLTFGG